MLLFAIFLVITPLIMDPVIENFYALLGVIGTLIIYIPFVHFKIKIPGTGMFHHALYYIDKI